MGSTGTGRVCESTISRERARERAEIDEAEKRRRARGVSSHNPARKKIPDRETVVGSTVGSMGEADD